MKLFNSNIIVVSIIKIEVIKYDRCQLKYGKSSTEKYRNVDLAFTK